MSKHNRRTVLGYSAAAIGAGAAGCLGSVEASSDDEESDELEILGDDPDLPVVAVLATGGTIAAEGEEGDLTDYAAGEVEGAELVSGVPEIFDHANVVVEQIANVGSSSITEKELLDLAQRANELLSKDDPEIAGVVIPHGTNTLEETTWFMNLTVDSKKPVVSVGAARPPTALSPDGPLNLVNAVRVAAAEDAQEKGAMVVMNDEINAARDVTKSNTYRVSAFRSGELGVLGYADDDEIVFNREQTSSRHTYNSEFDVSGIEELPDVGIVMSHQEASGVALDALVEEGYDGVVVHGHGNGAIAPDMNETILEEDYDIPIVLTTQSYNSRIQHSEDDLEEGIISGEDLAPLKARILLRLALKETDEFDEFVRMFKEY